LATAMPCPNPLKITIGCAGGEGGAAEMCSIRKVITARRVVCVSSILYERKKLDFTPATDPVNHPKVNTNRKSPIGNRLGPDALDTPATFWLNAPVYLLIRA
jgi:hypothetical protein